MKLPESEFSICFGSLGARSGRQRQSPTSYQKIWALFHLQGQVFHQDVACRCYYLHHIKELMTRTTELDSLQLWSALKWQGNQAESTTDLHTFKRNVFCFHKVAITLSVTNNPTTTSKSQLSCHHNKLTNAICIPTAIRPTWIQLVTLGTHTSGSDSQGMIWPNKSI